MHNTPLPFERLRFGVDLDDVTYKWEDTARYLIKRHHDIVLPQSQSWTDVHDRVGERIWKWLWKEGVEQHGLFRHGSLVAGAKSCLDEISKKWADPIAITYRPQSARWDTYEWISYHRLPFSEIHILGDTKKDKSDVEHCQIYVDDSPKALDNLMKHTSGMVLIFDRPWNKDWKPFYGDSHRTHRVYDWDEIVDFVRDSATGEAA